MEIVGTGVDIVDISRARRARYLRRVAEFIFNDEELTRMRASRDEAQFFSSRLAAKEAVIKAFPLPLTYHDFSIVPLTRGVGVHFSSDTSYHALVSIAHEIDYAVGYALVCRP